MADLIKDIELKPDLLTKTAETNLGYNAKIVVGGSDPLKFVPNINASFERKVGDEFYFNVNANDVLVSGEIAVISKETEITVGDRTDKFYVDPDGFLEYEIILNKKPDSNKINLKIQCSPVLEFWHQAVLTPEEIAEVGNRRPDDIINSYAIYCGKGNNEYQTGKVAHIKRSWVEDSTKQRQWCEQEIVVDKGVGIWTITIPDSVYNSNNYPLIIGPKFGYETQGASPVGLANEIRGTAYLNEVGAGNVDSISAYINGWGSSELLKYAIYDNSDDLVGVTVEGSAGAGAGFIELAASGSFGVSDDTTYHLDAWADSAMDVYYDSESVDRHYKGSAYNGTYPDPFDGSSGTNSYRYSIFCTFAAGGVTIEINVNETVTITENLNTRHKQLNIDVNDTVTVGEALD